MSQLAQIKKKGLTDEEINPRWTLQLKGLDQTDIDINQYPSCIVGEAYQNLGIPVNDNVDMDDPYHCNICKLYANKFVDYFEPINHIQDYLKSHNLIDNTQNRTEFEQVRAGFYAHFNSVHVR